MNNLTCPECGSSTIHTERRPDGFHHCINCWHRWKIGVKQSNPTVFQKITASPQVLAPYCICIKPSINGETLYYYSTVTGDIYLTKAEANAATIRELERVMK